MSGRLLASNRGRVIVDKRLLIGIVVVVVIVIAVIALTAGGDKKAPETDNVTGAQTEELDYTPEQKADMAADEAARLEAVERLRAEPLSEDLLEGD